MVTWSPRLAANVHLQSSRQLIANAHRLAASDKFRGDWAPVLERLGPGLDLARDVGAFNHYGFAYVPLDMFLGLADRHPILVDHLRLVGAHQLPTHLIEPWQRIQEHHLHQGTGGDLLLFRLATTAKTFLPAADGRIRGTNGVLPFTPHWLVSSFLDGRSSPDARGQRQVLMGFRGLCIRQTDGIVLEFVFSLAHCFNSNLLLSLSSFEPVPVSASNLVEKLIFSEEIGLEAENKLDLYNLLAFNFLREMKKV